MSNLERPIPFYDYKKHKNIKHDYLFSSGTLLMARVVMVSAEIQIWLKRVLSWLSGWHHRTGEFCWKSAL